MFIEQQIYMRRIKKRERKFNTNAQSDDVKRETNTHTHRHNEHACRSFQTPKIIIEKRKLVQHTVEHRAANTDKFSYANGKGVCVLV